MKDVCPWRRDSCFTGRPWSVANTRAAAYRGHLECLRALYENGCPWDSGATSEAASRGQLSCLKYLVENGCPVTMYAMRYAVWDGHYECLKYLHEHGCPPCGSDDVIIGLRRGNPECYRYFTTNIAPIDIDKLYEEPIPQEIEMDLKGFNL